MLTVNFTVHLLPLPLLAQSQRDVDQLPRAHRPPADQILLPRANRLLAATAPRRKHRGAPQGLLANVHSPHLHERAALLQLRLLPDQSRQRDPVHHGSCRHFASRKSPPSSLDAED